MCAASAIQVLSDVFFLAPSRSFVLVGGEKKNNKKKSKNALPVSSNLLPLGRHFGVFCLSHSH